MSARGGSRDAYARRRSPGNDPRPVGEKTAADHMRARYTLTPAGLDAVGADPNPTCPACATVMVPLVGVTRD